MEPERKSLQKRGRSWLGPFIVTAIDDVLRTNRPERLNTERGHCADIIDLIISPLVVEKVPNDILEHLKIDFVEHGYESPLTEVLSKDLCRIQDQLTAEFGEEVVRRLKLSVVEEKVRILPR